MRITVNGENLALDIKDGDSLGALLAGADNLLDKAGSVIVSMKIDGVEIDADGYSLFAERDAGSVESVEIQAEDAAAIRVRAIETLIELLTIARRSSEDGAVGDWTALRTGALDMRDAFAGLFTADELSFVQLFADILERAGDQPDRASRIEVSAQSDRLSAVFGERLAELRSPAGEMGRAATLFEDRASELADLPVLLQTGKEDKAMKAILFFIEIFNKVIRIIPELRRSGVDTAAISVGGLALPDFYRAFNDVLRELTDAFEHKDTVLIGDLAEYEVLPRMSEFFTAMRKALAES